MLMDVQVRVIPLTVGHTTSHILAMIIFKPGVIVRQSVRSFGSEGASEANGDVAFRDITARWHNAR